MYPANTYVIRHATESDSLALRLLAELDSQRPFAAPALIAEAGGVPVAAISVFDERIVADPFQPTAVVSQLLRMRLGALRAYSSTPSLGERLRTAFRPFVAANARLTARSSERRLGASARAGRALLGGGCTRAETMQRFLCMPRLRQIQDAQLLRAMAHPLRIQLIGALRKDGPATASEMARRFGESSGSTSYHLRELEKYGFVEEAAERNRGRTKHWRAVDEGMEWSIDTRRSRASPGSSVLGRELVAEYSRWLLRWFAETPEWDRRWRAAAEGTRPVVRADP